MDLSLNLMSPLAFSFPDLRNKRQTRLSGGTGIADLGFTCRIF